MISTFPSVKSQRVKTNPIGDSSWKGLLCLSVVFLLACWVFFTALGNFPLFNPDEALYAEPAREMLDTGEFITTTLNYAVRFTKPPLCIWAMSLCYQVLGVNEFAARFFGAACGAILVACTYLFLSRFANIRTGMFAALTLASAPLFLATGREAITDMPLALFITASLFCFYRAFNERDGFWRWLGYGLIGLAVMTKGPVGVVLPAAILLAYHFLRGNLHDALRFYKPQWGAMLVAAIALPWFAAEIAVTKGAYFREFILRENFQRFTSVVDSHKGGWWYHLLAMMGGYFPWSVFLPQALSRLIRLDPWQISTVPAIEQSRQSPPKQALLVRLLTRYRVLDSERDLLLFAACFALVTLVFFSASVSKLIPYTVPAFPALAILVGLELNYICSQGLLARLMAPLAVLAVMYGGAGILGPSIFSKMRHIPHSLFLVANGLLSFQCLATVTAVFLGFLRRPFAAIMTFTVLTLASTAFFGYKTLEVLSGEWEAPIPAFARFAALSGEPIFVYKIRKPSVTFYAHRAVALSPNQEDLTSDVETELSKIDSAYIIASKADEQRLMSTPGFKTAVQEGSFVLLHWRQQK